MQDYVIDTDSTISFAVEYGGKRILEEEYVPDGQNQVRVRRLGHFCELALWGVWCAGEVHWQLSVAGTFSFFIDNVKDMDCHVTYSILQTRKSADAPGVLSEATQKVTRPGVPEYASGFLAGSGYSLSGIGTDGVEKSVEVAVPSQGDAPFTVDASYSRVCQQLGVSSLRSYRVGFSGGSLEFLVDASRYADLRVFRFKNVYDMPETLACTGGLTLAGSNESDTAMMWGVERKFGLKVTDEYTALSGPIYLRQEYKLWHNLLNAREAEILCGEEWLPIVVTKQKLERDFRRSALAQVEFSFRLADPTQNNIIE